jgi:heme a synthase
VIKLFRRFGIITIASVVILIFVGGVVRATGSGMGCPDWPKCFGMWVPPTQVDQLPLNYQQIFGAKLKGEVVFNPIKTWIEYVNRLLGALIGLFIFLTFIFSFISYRKTNSKIVTLSFLAFVLVGFEGWLGSKVVSSELHPLLVTLHMLVSIIILGILIFVILKSYNTENSNLTNYNLPGVSFLMMLGMALVIAQIVFGTQIREGIDEIQKLSGNNNRELWLDNVKGKVVFHSGLAMLILFLNIVVLNKIRKKHKSEKLYKWSKWMTITVLASVISGAILGTMGLPAIVQPFHLTFSVVIISLQFVVYFMLKPELI